MRHSTSLRHMNDMIWHTLPLLCFLPNSRLSVLWRYGGSVVLILFFICSVLVDLNFKSILKFGLPFPSLPMNVVFYVKFFYATPFTSPLPVATHPVTPQVFSLKGLSRFCGQLCFFIVNMLSSSKYVYRTYRRPHALPFPFLVALPPSRSSSSFA